LDDLEKTKDAEVKALEDLSKAWDLYLKELEWDYNEFERINNERILKELMGCETEEEIRERITTDMKKFNQNALENYKNYNTIFQDNLLTPYKNNLVELQKLYEQTAQLVNSINGLWVNNNNNLTYDQLLADSAANNKLNLSVDYSAQMLAAKDEETFWKLANLRD
jgi:HD-GYP domain-containing protein (c-di-GMP phosphodiesterase class II)